MKFSIYLIFVVVCLVNLMNKGLAYPETCGEASVHLGLCWAQASVDMSFKNIQIAAECCDMFTRWSRDCFGGDDQIPRIVSHWVPPALVQCCSTHH